MDNLYLGEQGIVSAKEAADAPVVAFGLGPYPNYAFTFNSTESFQQWVDQQPYKDRVAEAMAKTQLAQEVYAKNPDAAVGAQWATTKRLRSEMNALANELGLDVNSRELFLKATVDADPIKGPIFRSAQLFDGPNCTGARLDIPSWTWWPDLSVFGFSDRISSVRVHAWSILILFNDPVFRGASRWFFGGLWWSNEFNLDPEVNNRVSSAICI